jgi:hypothetical protein
VATLTKGPVALLVTLLVYLAYKLIWNRRNFPLAAMLKFSAVFLLVILAWFGSIVLFTEDGAETVRKFIVYQAELFSQDVAGHARPFYYHALVFTFGCFPMAAFAYRGMALRAEDNDMRLLKRFMLAWFWVVMVLFSLATTKIVHYSSLLYFPGAFLAAMYFRKMLEGKKKATWDVYLLYGIGMLVFGLLFASVNWLPDFLRRNVFGSGDEYLNGVMTAQVHWTGFEFLPGALLFLVLAVNLWFLMRRRYRTWLLVMVVAMPAYLNLVNALVVPRIADYTQNAAVNFLREKSGEDAYFMVDGFKSYAHYFYGKTQPFPHPEIPKEERGAWLARGPADKPVYLVTKGLRSQIPHFHQAWFPDFELIRREGGYEFFVRNLPSGNHLPR